jgi:lactate dehydrogenase-like 2-hydroxyacid dehydrogenase
VASARDVEVLFGGFISERLLDAAPSLRLIQIPWAGVDALDYELLTRYSIPVCNSHSGAMVVAEHAIALMMDAAKKISYHDRQLRQGNWNRVSSGSADSISPFSKSIYRASVGVVGYGAIGKAICKLLSGFACSFRAFRRRPPFGIQDPGPVNVFPFSEILGNLGDLDVVFACVPLTAETKGLVDDRFLHAMGRRAILVNISRGEVTREEDLFRALLEKSIGSAALDTWYNYPSQTAPQRLPSERFPFHTLDNLVLSPHRAGYAEGGFPHLDDAIDNLNRLYCNERVINRISLEERY